MQMNHAAFSSSRALRMSLKRGLARQALASAERDAADLPALFRTLFRTNPNRKGMERATLRLRTCPGVTRAAVAADGRGLTVIARSVQEVDSCVEGETAFSETALVYLRIGTRMRAGSLCFRLSAVSVCRHAIERLVERADVPVNGTLLARVDAEARGIFGGWDRGARIVDDGDEFYPSATPGVWAGGHDRMAIDTDWGLAEGDMLVFSVRTFLSESQMRPTVWLRWRNDPACRLL